MNQRRWLVGSGLALLFGLALLGWRQFSGKSASSLAVSQPGSIPAQASSPEIDASRNHRIRNSDDVNQPSITRAIFSGKKVEIPPLTDLQIQQFLNHQGRSAESLLAASRMAANDRLSYLHEAARLFPNQPMVQLELALKSTDPAERQVAMDQFRRLAPDNSYGGILSAARGFKDGRQENALQDLEAALLHSHFDLYENTYADQEEAAYRMAGFAPNDAANVAITGVFDMGVANPLSDLGRDLNKARVAAIDAGNPEMAARLLDAGMAASHALEEQSTNGAQLGVGLAMESYLLKRASPSDVLPDGRSVSQALLDLEQRNQSLSIATNMALELLPTLSDEELLRYEQEVREKGDLRAIQRLRESKR